MTSIYVTEAVTTVETVDDITYITVTDEITTISEQVTGVQGPSGATGASGVIAVTSPITNSGTSTSAQLGLDQTLLTIAESQVTNLVSDLAGKAPASGISPSAIAGTAVITTDSRLSDQRVPTDASVTDAKIATTLSPSKVTGTAVITTDSRLSDARTPTTHASTHGVTGSDPVTVAASQVTGTAVVQSPTASQTISASGFVPLAVTQSGSAHALTSSLTATTGADITALNVVSNNNDSSAVWLTGTEKQHGTLKVAHVQPSTSGMSDANASAISINLMSDATRAGASDATTAQGIYMDTYQPDGVTKYPTTGTLLNLKNGGNQKLVLDANGQLQLPQTTATGGLKIGGDTTLYRAAATVLRTDGSFYPFRSGTDAVTIFTSTVSGRGTSNADFTIANSGKCSWGAGGAATDTNLYRSTTNTLKTDSNFVAATVTATIDGGSA